MHEKGVAAADFSLLNAENGGPFQMQQMGVRSVRRGHAKAGALLNFAHTGQKIAQRVED
jgi:hypothetical protein